MDAEKQREIARKGGRAAHEKGTAHEFTTDEARAAGRKGGERVSANREHMSRIGRLGGKMSAGRRLQTGGAASGDTGNGDDTMAEPGQMQRTDHGAPDGNGAAQPGAMSQ
jgi:general stress protein YciG